ncbi:hypothetical protein [Enterococcus faecium]|uniref:hypothetical protein n=1 Tax=Enterococcus faecium TaxID=1352 RepID=UPI002F962B8F
MKGLPGVLPKKIINRSTAFSFQVLPLVPHHYTASWKEVQWLTKDYGWKYEGIGWYGADIPLNPK